MNAQFPPPDDYTEPDTHDEDVDEASFLWSRVQAFFVLAVVAVTIAELVLAVRNQGLAHKALAVAGEVNATASHESSLLSSELTALQKLLGEINATTAQQLGQLVSKVSVLQNGMVEAKDNATSLQSGLKDVKGHVDVLQTKVAALDAARTSARTSTSMSASASAAPSASHYPYTSGGGERSRGGSMSMAAFCWMLIVVGIVESL